MKTNRLLDAALAAARRGWPVFPLIPGGKRPAIARWESQATTDPDRISRFWANSTYNYGIACGPAGLIVVDLDRPKGGQERFNDDGSIYTGAVGYDQIAAEAEGETGFAQTFTVATPSGGWHLYFAHPEGPQLRNTTGKLAYLIDTRTHGGYVVGPGSVINEKPYAVTCRADAAPLPTWLAQRLRPAEHTVLAPRATPAARQIQAQRRSARLTGYLTAAVNRETQTVATAAEGTRNHRLYCAAVALGQLVAAGHLTEADVTDALTSAAQAAGLEAHETARTIASGLTAGAKNPRHLPEPAN